MFGTVWFSMHANLNVWSGNFFIAVPQPDPNQPKPEGRQMTPVKGEPLGVVCNWPPALEAALQRWGTTQAKCPCLTALDVTGKPVYTLTYGKLHAQQLNLLYRCGIFPQWASSHLSAFAWCTRTMFRKVAFCQICIYSSLCWFWSGLGLY